MRLLHRLYAWLLGYYWLPCNYPGCGRMYGGHETSPWTTTVFVMGDDGVMRDMLTCRKHDQLPHWLIQVSQ
jgi:hypothetical protein